MFALSRDLALNMGRLALVLPSCTSGLYTIETGLDGVVDTFNVQIYARMETSAPLRL